MDTNLFWICFECSNDNGCGIVVMNKIDERVWSAWHLIHANRRRLSLALTFPELVVLFFPLCRTELRSITLSYLCDAQPKVVCADESIVKSCKSDDTTSTFEYMILGGE